MVQENVELVREAWEAWERRQVYRLRDGRAVRLAVYVSQDEALEAAGMAQ